MTKEILSVILFIGLLSGSVLGQKPTQSGHKALRIVNKNAALPDSIRQLLVVFNETSGQDLAVLVALEKKGNKWQTVTEPMQAGIGRKGFAAPGAKREGDDQSPTGLFRLGQLFCYDKNVDTRIPFIQTTPEDKWIDDPNSPDYNRYIRGTTQAKSYEKLLLNGNDYRYCMVIEYNTNPVIKGHGSAIFLHLSEYETINSSSGCVVLLRKDMEKLLKWMNPESKPSILMGTEKVLMSGLKSKK
ncbi:MAG: L,D-transpeptidase family protein [Prolixibacteraceae bacterium]|nr:L,D-transpeptidase family protein [Prolixibacteraceae bacterium]